MPDHAHLAYIYKMGDKIAIYDWNTSTNHYETTSYTCVESKDSKDALENRGYTFDRTEHLTVPEILKMVGQPEGGL